MTQVSITTTTVVDVRELIFKQDFIYLCNEQSRIIGIIAEKDVDFKSVNGGRWDIRLRDGGMVHNP